MKELYRLKEMLCDEIKQITEQGKLTSASLQAADTIVDVIKDIDTIEAMEQYGDYDYDDEASYRRGMSRTNQNYRMNDNYYNHPMNYDYSNRGMSYRNDYYDNGYSRHTATEKMINELEMMMKDAETSKEKNTIQRCIDELKNK